MTLTLTIKWLSGEITPLIVEYGITVIRVIQCLGQPLYKTTLFQGDEVLPHWKKIKEDTHLSILVQDPPSTAIVFRRNRVDYYCSIYESMEPKLFSSEKISLFEKVYVDYLTYPNIFFFPEKRQELNERLGIHPEGDAHIENLLLFYHTFKGTVRPLEVNENGILQQGFLREEHATLRWVDFVKSFNLLFSENIEKICFPTLTSDIKRFAIISPGAWTSYFAIQGKND